jgi:formate dehydrogenase subunit gamma
VVLGGAAMAITGYMLMFPFYGTDVESMQTAQMIHAVVAVLFVAVMLGHIYIGTIGMEGAFEAMATGTVDRNWAREHHSVWLEEKETGSRQTAAPRGAATPPAE